MSVLTDAVDDLRAKSEPYHSLELGVMQLELVDEETESDASSFVLVGVDTLEDEIMEVMEAWESRHPRVECVEASPLEDIQGIEVREYRVSDA